jgi:hypothetical protein
MPTRAVFARMKNPSGSNRWGSPLVTVATQGAMPEGMRVILRGSAKCYPRKRFSYGYAKKAWWSLDFRGVHYDTLR